MNIAFCGVQSGFILKYWIGTLHVTQTSWQVMQRDSDTADSGKPRIVLYRVKRSMNKSVAVFPQVW